jgi:ribosomal protein L23
LPPAPPSSGSRRCSDEGHRRHPPSDHHGKDQATDATKIDIKRAVEKLFGSKVASVRTQIGHGKFKRQGRFAGQRPDRKKAWVRLKEGQKMPEFMEGA